MRKTFAAAVGVLAVVLAAMTARAEPSEEAKKEFNRAVGLVKEGKADSAISAYEAAIKQTPDYLDAHVNVGALYYEKKQLTDAASHLEAALKLDSTNADAYKTLGLVYVQTDKLDQAMATFTKLGTLDAKKSAAGWVALGQAKKKKGDTAGALDAYNKAVKADPSDSRTLYNMGNLHMGAQHYEDAIASYRKAMAVNPKYTEAYYNLAICSNTLDESKCVADYEAFLKVAGTGSKWKTQVAAAQAKVKELKAKQGGH